FSQPAPLTAPESIAVETPSPPVKDEEPAILIAEDNLVNQKVALLQLRKLGYFADVVPNGREAVTALRRRRYALVLMDAQMPEVDGFTATRIVRKAEAEGDPDFPGELPIIAMTASVMAGDREACIAAGMNDYLAKPLKLEALRKILASYLPVASSAA
ncbi:MAG: response regulator, partial [Verrucomicrobiota bacterium]|nr:response regulator [Verrucomicrobiota bacterium]